MKFYLLFISFFFNFLHLFAQGNLSGMPSEPGKCYAQCYTDTLANYPCVDYFLNVTDTLAYAVSSKRRLVYNLPRSQRWVQKKAQNCDSPQVEDCLVWCLVDVPASKIHKTLLVLDNDTYDLYIANPSVFTASTRTYDKSSMLVEWKEVLCGDDPNYHEKVCWVAERLDDYGFYEMLDRPNKLTSDLKKSLIKFQKHYQLPIGQLDMKTLEALEDLNNIDYVEKNLSREPLFRSSAFFMIPTITHLAFKGSEGYHYYGKNKKELKYFNAITGKKIKWKNYNPHYAEHLVVEDQKFELMIEKEREYFKLESIKIDPQVVYELDEFAIIGEHEEAFPHFAILVEDKLKDLGYKVDGAFGDITRSSLASLQKLHKLPVGFLDFGTLDLLNITY